MLGLIVMLQTLILAVTGPATSPEYLPLRVAEAEGYFKREGLVVVLKTTRAEVGAAEALAQGQVDLAATSPDVEARAGPHRGASGGTACRQEPGGRTHVRQEPGRSQNRRRDTGRSRARMAQRGPGPGRRPADAGRSR